MKNPNDEIRLAQARNITRRHFFRNCNAGLGAIALASLGVGNLQGATHTNPGSSDEQSDTIPMIPPRAKNVIYLHMAGSPPQHELFDFKPELVKRNLQECPEEMIEGKTFAFIKGRPKLLGSVYPFQQFGETGAWMSETVPHLSDCADDLCFVKSMYTDQFNHAPAQLLLHTGNQQFGGASFGSWVTYGLGSVNQNLPGYIVMVSGGTNPSGGKALWGSSYLPSVYQGVQCRSGG
ncbi:MAG: DUF1501 domain-containing protein, partial [Planctomycetota bacterium]